tara:strand:- start:18 stop:323 length:306 start_codon:yes stop_codon:yes gene_type:complete
MALRNIKGLACEIKGQLQFLQNPNLLVFTPLGGLGPIDIVTVNKKTAEINLYDVKAVSLRKSSKTYLDKHGYKVTNKAGYKIYRKLTQLQKKLGVKILYVE